MGKHERDSSRLDERKRHKRRRDEDKKKKHKKHKDKERKSHRRHKRSCHSSGSDSDSDSDRVPVADYMRAMKVVRELLTETPGLASDLLGLLQMVDDGEVAVVGGIENRRIRSKLKELFPLLGLVKLREPKGAFAKPLKAKDKGECLMEVFQRMLSGGSEKDLPQPATKREQGDSLTMEDADPVEEKPAVQKPIKRDLPIGPALPPASGRTLSRDIENDDDDDDDDDEVVGPALPGMKGFRLADEHVEAEMIRKAEQLEKEQWERTRDGGKDKEGKEAPAVREAWMTMMPESSILKDSLGPQNRPPGKPAAFRSKEPARVDKTWFDSPEERERAKRAKLDMELIGYVREENAPSTAAASSMPATMGQPTVNESILPNANPEADEEMRKQMENLRKSRGPSLLEQHQRKQAEHAKIGVGSTQSVGGWNRFVNATSLERIRYFSHKLLPLQCRDRDLAVRRGMSGDDAERMISAAKQINSKFTAPTISRQFL
ncbi:hypothetical protein F441_07035 [Phytophthora nicotianae CJ01A1]|uniref:DUF3752 domain-containing protein n=10 Tax=Phytophthora nicotianae TaxID=4792 RepID=W2QD73_PHYN3|nr:hypothetical protein PPTG_10110 [Phytophthora nicotianae INRA-310]ETI49027.1 hypothetical protein F443_07023 [Phytophthora nicotianae P1569]ETK88895.1 hypothetical protein L915_06924 [Phytophthora nicotianae]ETP18794.1 hypothetical protein F441_07035 [Phytophthora nicotianae CJ01A1]ETL42293.1 hypothetical protein L916_06872 [Phytophthora nicotianae]ETL95467.1 hypothetical protein L917_06740 [Phytophthora nicotianae]